MRRPILIVMALALAALAVAGWRVAPGAGYPASAGSMSTTVLRSALDQEWYCSVATAVSKGQAAGQIVLANASASSLTGVVTVYGNSGQAPGQRAFTLPPASRAVLGEQQVLSSGFVAATVVFRGGGGSAEQEVSGPLGVSVTPCATQPSGQWYFASGSTQPGASLVLSLFNPFPEDALANLSFDDPQGQSAPSEFQGLYVPARGLVTVDVGQHVVQVDDVATTVNVKVGRLVASELQLDARPKKSGLSLLLGAPQPASRWYLPDGVEATGVDEAVHLFNPGPAAAQVTVDLRLARGVASPFKVLVGPGAEAVVDLAGQTRIPDNDPFDAVVTARGSPVVVQRSVTATAPSTRTGASSMLGAPSPARDWVLPAGGATSSPDEWVDGFDPGRRAAIVKISYLDNGTLTVVPGLGSVRVPAGGRVALRLGDHLQLADLSALVSSSQPVVVEEDIYQVSSIGLSTSLGEPLAP